VTPVTAPSTRDASGELSRSLAEIEQWLKANGYADVHAQSVHAIPANAGSGDRQDSRWSIRY
jgi:hypothetical protein